MATANPKVSPDVATVEVKVLTKPEMDISTSVRSLEVEDNDRLIDKATIIMDDPHEAGRDIPKEGLRLTIAMGWGKERAVLFEGIIVQVTVQGQGGIPQVEIVAFDPSCLMMVLKPSPKEYTGKVSEIIKKIVQAYQIDIGQIVVDPDVTIPEKPPLLQVGRRDWEFIQYLALALRARAYVEYNVVNKEGKARFYFHPESRLLSGQRMGTLTYCHGFSQVIDFEFHRMASGSDAQRSATAVDPKSGDAVTTPQAPPKPPVPPVTPQPSTKANLAKVSATEASIYQQALDAVSKTNAADQFPQEVVLGPPSHPALPQQAGRQDPTRILGLLGQGTVVGNIKLRAKGKVAINGIAAWAEGDWYVRKVTHIYTRVIDEKKRDRSTYRAKFVVTR